MQQCFLFSSVKALPIPELMPFRLTKQFRNLLLPLKDLGPYKLPMTSVMRALRSNSDILLCTMDIFVNEPLVDWQVGCLIVYLRLLTSQLVDTELSVLIITFSFC